MSAPIPLAGLRPPKSTRALESTLVYGIINNTWVVIALTLPPERTHNEHLPRRTYGTHSPSTKSWLFWFPSSPVQYVCTVSRYCGSGVLGVCAISRGEDRVHRGESSHSPKRQLRSRSQSR